MFVPALEVLRSCFIFNFLLKKTLYELIGMSVPALEVFVCV